MIGRPAAMPFRATLAVGTRAFWLRQMRLWHWVSSALCLVGMLLFAVTGITLNHAADIPASRTTETRAATLPPEQLALLPAQASGKAPIPVPVRRWIERQIGASAGGEAEWSADEVYLALPHPGGDASLTLDRQSGAVQYERTDRGWIALLNDLHKGRDAGMAWHWFLDVFAVACIVFATTGLLLLHLHAGARPATWPVVGLGLVLPLLIVILLVH